MQDRFVDVVIHHEGHEDFCRFPVLSGPGSGSTFITLGRSPSADIQVPEGSVSNFTGVLRYAGGEWKVWAVGRGVFVDGVLRSGSAQAVRKGTELRLGGSSAVVRIERLDSPFEHLATVRSSPLVALILDTVRYEVIVEVADEPPRRYDFSPRVHDTWRLLLLLAEGWDGGSRCFMDLPRDEELQARGLFSQTSQTRSRLNKWWRDCVLGDSEAMQRAKVCARLANGKGGYTSATVQFQRVELRPSR